MADGESFRIQADLVVATASQFYAPGQLELRGGRIVDVGYRRSRTPDVTLDGYALLPGLVNAHTHLEFSDLTQPLPAGKTFPDWIASVLAERRARGPHCDEGLVQALATGLHQSRRAGVSVVVDIVTPPWTPAHLKAAAAMHPNDDDTYQQWPASLGACFSLDKLRQLKSCATSRNDMPAVVACLEQLGLTAERIESARRWRTDVESFSTTDWPANLRSLGLSPHAPYSTLLSETSLAIELAAAQKRLIAMHVVESVAEREWIDRGTGPFAEFHATLGVGPVPRSATTVVELCHSLAAVPHALLIHGNYLSQAEMEAIAAHRENISVVYCPRTHHHLGHAAYPLEALTSCGIRVVLGTDSRSSNPDLNLWQEARTALATHANLRPSTALSAITYDAARAIGCQADFGSLLPGRAAAIGALPLDPTMRSKNIEEVIAYWFDAMPHPIPLNC
jgi:aminodeoxyfutalosine deaminase